MKAQCVKVQSEEGAAQGGGAWGPGLGLSGEEARKPLQNIRRGQTELWLPHLLLL